MTTANNVIDGELQEYRYLVAAARKNRPVCDTVSDRSSLCVAIPRAVKDQARVNAYFVGDDWVGLVLEMPKAYATGITEQICAALSSDAARNAKGVSRALHFESAVLHTAAEVLAIIRHCHRSPVTAGLASEPSQYFWSSHRAYLGLDKTAWLSRSAVARMLAPEPGGWPAGYRRLMEELPDGETRPSLLWKEVPVAPTSPERGDRACLAWLRSRPEPLRPVASLQPAV